MNKKSKKRLVIFKILPKVLFFVLFIILTKVKFSLILGTDTQFSASVMFGPVISNFLGIGWGLAVIILSHLFGIVIGLYKVKSAISWLTFAPIIIAGIYFSKMFKGDTRLVLIPLFCILLFFSHPIGREVWYYSLFWVIPIFIASFKTKLDKLLKKHIVQVYVYSLGSALTDHSIGSIIYLYFINIPAKFWVEAIPFTLVERAMIAAGITLSYFAVKVSISFLQQAMRTMTLAKSQKETRQGYVHAQTRSKKN